MTRSKDNSCHQDDYESKQETKKDFWYSIALLVGNIGIIVKVLSELIADKKK